MPATKYYPVYFAPDLDPAWLTNPGILSDVTDLVPSKRGTYKSYASTDTQDSDGGAFLESTYGVSLYGQVSKKVDGTARLIVGTTKRLVESDGSAWTDRSAGGTDYTTASDWAFTTYGNHLIACSKANAVQMSNGSGAFSALSGSPPKASCCTTNKNFVILGDTNDGTDDFGDRVWWSALGDDTDWTPDAATQSGNLRITDTAGNVSALVNMRDAVAVYKEDSLYILDYQGSTLLWTARLISDRVGCAAKNGVAVVSGIHYFLHRTGVHRFDGASVQNIGGGVNKYLFDKMGSQVNYATVQAVYDEYEGTILWYFHDTGAAAHERRYALAYHPETDRFGFVKLAWFSGTGTCRAVVRATLSDLTAWSSTQATETTNVLTVGLETTNAILRRPVFGNVGGGGSVSFVTGDIGSDIDNTNLTAIKVRMLSISNSMSAATVKGKQAECDAYDAGSLYLPNLVQREWNNTKSSRWLQLTMSFVDHVEIAGLYLTTAQAGTK